MLHNKSKPQRIVKEIVSIACGNIAVSNSVPFRATPCNGESGITRCARPSALIPVPLMHSVALHGRGVIRLIRESIPVMTAVKATRPASDTQQRHAHQESHDRAATKRFDMVKKATRSE